MTLEERALQWLSNPQSWCQDENDSALKSLVRQFQEVRMEGVRACSDPCVEYVGVESMLREQNRLRTGIQRAIWTLRNEKHFRAGDVALFDLEELLREESK